MFSSLKKHIKKPLKASPHAATIAALTNATKGDGMKKIIFAASAAGLVLVAALLSACGGGSDEANKEQSTTTETVQTANQGNTTQAINDPEQPTATPPATNLENAQTQTTPVTGPSSEPPVAPPTTESQTIPTTGPAESQPQKAVMHSVKMENGKLVISLSHDGNLATNIVASGNVESVDLSSGNWMIFWNSQTAEKWYPNSPYSAKIDSFGATIDVSSLQSDSGDLCIAKEGENKAYWINPDFVSGSGVQIKSSRGNIAW